MVSVFLHLALFGFFWRFANLFERKKESDRSEWLEVVTIPEDGPQVEKEIPSEVVKEKVSPDRRVVQTEILQETKEIDQNAFLGEKNQKILDQKISSGETKEEIIAKSQKAIKSTTSETVSPPVTMGNLGVSMPVPLKTQEESKTATDEMAIAGQAASVHDYVPGVKESERTLLNTKEFKYYSYFQRIRKQLDLSWRPILQDKLHRFFESGRQLSMNRDHITEVLVFLNDQGKIISVKILSESGTKDLDESAINAFNRAGPFPNPPKGLVESDGTVKVRWEFVLRT